MAAEILDTWTQSKCGDDRLNEDAFVVADDVVAIFDGETDKSGSDHPTPGRLGVQALTKAMSCFPASASSTEVVEFLQSAVRSVSDPDCTPVAVCAVLDLRGQRVIRVGDVSVCVGGVLHRAHKQLDDIAGNARAALLHSMLRSGADADLLRAQDPGREMILPLLRAAAAWRNVADTALGFAALDGTATPASMIDVYDVPAGAEVVLATDGYLDVQPCLDQAEEAHAQRIRSDPLRLGPPPGTKGVRPGSLSFDDRTYVRVRV